MSGRYHLAQANIARMLGALEDPVMAGFVEWLWAQGPAPEAFTFRQRFEAPA